MIMRSRTLPVRFIATAFFSCALAALASPRGKAQTHRHTAAPHYTRVGVHEPYSVAPAIDTSKFMLYLRYPVSAYRSGVEGTVVVDVYLDRVGSVWRTRTRPGDDPRLTLGVENAIAMLKDDPQTPRRLGGEPVDGIMQLTVRFDSSTVESRAVRFQDGLFDVHPTTWSAAADSVGDGIVSAPDVPASVDSESLERATRYPELARLRGINGEVLVHVLVDAGGTVVNCRVSMSDSPALDDAALRAVRGAKFRPGRLGDRPVSSWTDIPVRFQLRPTP